MKVSLNEIKQAFESLIQEKKTREEIANWAVKLQFAHDDKLLEFDPPHEKKKIWEGIEYLTGVDLKISHNIYFHCIEDFIDYKKNL